MKEINLGGFVQSPCTITLAYWPQNLLYTNGAILIAVFILYTMCVSKRQTQDYIQKIHKEQAEIRVEDQKMTLTIPETEKVQSISIKKMHEHYLDRWLHLYEYDEYKKWLFSELIMLLKKYVTSGSVLEIGCSRGYLCNQLDKCGYSSIGGDISLSALQTTKNIEIVRLDGETLPFKSQCFDAVLSIFTIEHLPKPARSIKEISRVLKKTGLFIATTPDKGSPLGKIGRHLVKYTSLKNPYHVGLMNKKELTLFLKEAGFKEVTLQPFHNGFLGAPILKAVRQPPFIPIPMQIHIPLSHHLVVVAHAYDDQEKNNTIET
jgi:SAM-dependent methyltransferase